MAKSKWDPRSVLRRAPQPHPASAHRDSWRAVLEEWRRSGLRQPASAAASAQREAVGCTQCWVAPWMQGSRKTWS